MTSVVGHATPSPPDPGWPEWAEIIEGEGSGGKKPRPPRRERLNDEAEMYRPSSIGPFALIDYSESSMNARRRRERRPLRRYRRRDQNGDAALRSFPGVAFSPYPF